MSLNKIPFDLLRGRENFDAWEIGAKSYLIIKDMWYWCENKPDAAKNDEIKKDAKARSELTLLLDPSLYAYVSKAVTAKDAQDNIVKSFQDSGSDLNIFTLQKFVTAKTSDFKTLEEYVNEMMKLWRRVQTAGYDIDEKTAGSLMLIGLPNEYRPMILGIKNSGVAITVDYVKSLLLQDVLFDAVRNDSENVLAVKYKGKKKLKKVKCFNCGGPHYRNKCTELKNSKNEKEKVLFSAFFTSKKSDEWFFDSGATANMSHEKESVKNIVKPKKCMLLRLMVIRWK